MLLQIFVLLCRLLFLLLLLLLLIVGYRLQASGFRVQIMLLQIFVILCRLPLFLLLPPPSSLYFTKLSSSENSWPIELKSLRETTGTFSFPAKQKNAIAQRSRLHCARLQK